MTLSPVYPVCLCVWLAAGAIECLPPSVELLVWLADVRGSERTACVPFPTADGEPPAMSAFTGMREGITGGALSDDCESSEKMLPGGEALLDLRQVETSSTRQASDCILLVEGTVEERGS